jgi:hypothetical protein
LGYKKKISNRVKKKIKDNLIKPYRIYKKRNNNNTKVKEQVDMTYNMFAKNKDAFVLPL